MARAVVGEPRSTSHLANARRSGTLSPWGIACRKPGTSARTCSVGRRKSPRCRTLVMRETGRSSKTSWELPSGYLSHSSSIFRLASVHSGTVVRQ